MINLDTAFGSPTEHFNPCELNPKALHIERWEEKGYQSSDDNRNPRIQ